MTPYYADDAVQLFHGDCLDVLRTLPDCSVDAVVTDPPAGISFMSKGWDGNKGGREQWSAWLADVMREALRVTKPGGHALVWALPRTSHWTACGLEDAGWEIRDKIVHLFGSGFPKSLDVSKAIDKMRHDGADKLKVTTWLADTAARNGVSRADVDAHMGTSDMGGWWLSRLAHRCAIPTLEQVPELLKALGLRVEDVPDEIRALLIDLNGMKGQPGPAWFAREVVGAASVPVGHAFAGSTYGGDSSGKVVDLTSPATPAAQQWAGWGTALKPAAEDWWLCRKPLAAGTVAANVLAHGVGALNIDGCRVGGAWDNRSAGKGAGREGANADGSAYGKGLGGIVADPHPAGRWPTNVVLDGDAAAALDRQSGERPGFRTQRDFTARKGTDGTTTYGAGIGKLEPGERDGYNDVGGASRFFPTFRYEPKAPSDERPRVDGVAHPTVKPLALMRWLVRLVTPPGGTVLEPFAGSGTTAEAAVIEGFRCIAIEREAAYLPLIVARLSKPIQPDLFGGAA